MLKLTNDPEDHRRARRRWEQAVAEIAAGARALAVALGFFGLFRLLALIMLAVFAASARA